MSGDAAPRLTELEEVLASGDGAARKEHDLARLTALELGLRRKMAASLPREDFAICAALADAAQAAHETLAAWPVAQSDAVPARPGPAYNFPH